MLCCGYIVDFACFETKLVVEVDGGQHASDEGRVADAARDVRLAEADFRVLRFWHHRVNREMPTVLAQIFAVCMARSPAPSLVEGAGTLPGPSY